MIDKDDVKNPDGSFNGVKFLSQLSGLSEAEVLWSFKRIRQLKSEGKSKEEQVRIVNEEGKSKPWEKT